MKKQTLRKKYYFVLCEVYSRGWKPDNMGGASTGYNTTTHQDVIDIHPLQYQQECNTKYEPIREESSGYKKSEIYKVLSWQPLTKSEYNKFKDYIG